MSFLELARKRYTTKKFDETKRVTPNEIEHLKEILQLSPSSINSQPWKFFIVSNDELKAQFAEASFFNAPKILSASHLVVFTVFDDLSLFEAQIEEHLPEGAVGYYKQFLKSKPESEVKSWLQHQVYLSLGFFLSACAEMDIDSTPMEGIENDKYDLILKLNGYKTLFAVAIGKRDESDTNQPHLKEKSRISQNKIVVEM